MKKNKSQNFVSTFIEFDWTFIGRPHNTYLKVSAGLPESAVLDGFVALSKLNVFGLSEWGEAVVELAIHNLESVIVFCRVVFEVVVEDDDE